MSEEKSLMQSEGYLPVKLAEISDFNKLLNSVPKSNEVKTNTMANGSLYIPIGIIEKKLDYYFNGLWQCKVIDSKVVVNEIMITVELSVFHPIAKIWITRPGVGAAQIRLKQGSEIDVINKIKNTIEADAPHALANAMKNAARKFGDAFGRSLNREDDWERYLIDDEVPAEQVVDMQVAKTEMNSCTLENEVKEIWISIQSYKT